MSERSRLLDRQLETCFALLRHPKLAITDRLLSDYPNMYGDMSAGSGLNALLRDEEHARGNAS